MKTAVNVRLLAALGATALAAFLAVAFALRALDSVPSSAAAPTTARATTRCVPPIPIGASERAAHAVVEWFLHETVVRAPASAVRRLAARQHPAACRVRTLAVPGLVPAHFLTRLPERAEGWYQLAPRIRNATGLWEYAAFVWLHAPDARPAAYEMLLELHGKRWLVSSFRHAPGSAEIDRSKLPT